MNDIVKNTPHRITLESREQMNITGVDDVINFDECGIVLKTAMGILSVDGSDMRIINLNLDTKAIDISGKINGIIYQGAQPNRGTLFKRK